MQYKDNFLVDGLYNITINSFSSLSYDRSKASTKASSPQLPLNVYDVFDQRGLNGCCTAMWKANGNTTTLLLFLDSLFPKI
jgi:hypothetical protein